jgi:hypothetical protein
MQFGITEEKSTLREVGAEKQHGGLFNHFIYISHKTMNLGHEV